MVSRLCVTISLVLLLYGTTPSEQAACAIKPTRVYFFISTGANHCFVENVNSCKGSCESSVYLKAAVNTSVGRWPSNSAAKTSCRGVQNCCVAGGTATYAADNAQIFPTANLNCFNIVNGMMNTHADPGSLLAGHQITYPTSCSCQHCESTSSGGGAQPLETRDLNSTFCMD